MSYGSEVNFLFVQKYAHFKFTVGTNFEQTARVVYFNGFYIFNNAIRVWLSRTYFRMSERYRKDDK